MIGQFLGNPFFIYYDIVRARLGAAQTGVMRGGQEVCGGVRMEFWLGLRSEKIK